jgi:carbamoyltransferase
MAETGNFLGISANHKIDIAGKLMGLQSYGNISEEFFNYLDKYSIQNVRELFSFYNWIRFVNDENVARLSTLDWIRTLHKKTGHLLVQFFKQFAKEDQLISFTGGIAQNVLWNTELRKHFKNIIIPPHCTDDGLTLGGIEFLRRKNNINTFELNNFPYIQNDEVPLTIPDINTIKKSALLLSQGHAIGWYQGNGEIGPRALGNRSILLDPRLENGKFLINKIKNRESYRPFGATILHEHKDDFFEIDSDSYMLFSSNVKNDSIKSVTHIDNTCRVQTLKNENPVFRLLLEEFYKLTGCPLLLNTSMNSAGKPLVGTITDAKLFFETSNLNYLIIGNEILQKN